MCRRRPNSVLLAGITLELQAWYLSNRVVAQYADPELDLQEAQLCVNTLSGRGHLMRVSLDGAVAHISRQTDCATILELAPQQEQYVV